MHAARNSPNVPILTRRKETRNEKQKAAVGKPTMESHGKRYGQGYTATHLSKPINENRNRKPHTERRNGLERAHTFITINKPTHAEKNKSLMQRLAV